MCYKAYSEKMRVTKSDRPIDVWKVIDISENDIVSPYVKAPIREDGKLRNPYYRIPTPKSGYIPCEGTLDRPSETKWVNEQAIGVGFHFYAEVKDALKDAREFESIYMPDKTMCVVVRGTIPVGTRYISNGHVGVAEALDLDLSVAMP